MKKLLIVALSVLCMIFCCNPVAQAETESIKLIWQHDVPADLDGFRVYISPATITSCEETSPALAADIDYTGQTSFTTDYTLTGNPEQVFYIRVTAYDTSNNESGCSEEVTYTFPPDTIPPNPPFDLIIEVVVMPPA